MPVPLNKRCACGTEIGLTVKADEFSQWIRCYRRERLEFKNPVCVKAVSGGRRFIDKRQ